MISTYWPEIFGERAKIHAIPHTIKKYGNWYLEVHYSNLINPSEILSCNLPMVFAPFIRTGELSSTSFKESIPQDNVQDIFIADGSLGEIITPDCYENSINFFTQIRTCLKNIYYLKIRLYDKDYLIPFFELFKCFFLKRSELCSYALNPDNIKFLIENYSIKEESPNKILTIHYSKEVRESWTFSPQFLYQLLLIYFEQKYKDTLQANLRVQFCPELKNDFCFPPNFLQNILLRANTIEESNVNIVTNILQVSIDWSFTHIYSKHPRNNFLEYNNLPNYLEMRRKRYKRTK